MCIKLAHSSFRDREDIFITHLFVTLSLVVCLRWLHHHMLSVTYISRESWVCFYYCASFIKYILSSVRLRLSQFSQLIFHALSGTLCIRFIYSLMMIVRIVVLYLDIIKRNVIQWETLQTSLSIHAECTTNCIGKLYLSLTLLQTSIIQIIHTHGYVFSWQINPCLNTITTCWAQFRSV